MLILSHNILLAAEEKIYEGTYSRGFEYSGFQAIDSQEVWWLSGKTAELYKLIHSKQQTVRSPGSILGQAHVKLKGKLRTGGRYGHMGRYSKELIVTEVISAKIIK
jgi:hypothetical protein